jgi:phospholipid/cholesterol/gamma-HCH transport system substrate-binding protein
MMRKAISFGIFAAMSLFLTFYIGAQIAHFKLGAQRYSLVATFDDATNLRAGDPVRLAGVEVGQVGGVKVVDGRARVQFQVDDHVQLPNDSEVAVRWLNLIGQRELYLYPGKSTESFKNNDTVSRTRSVVDLGELLNELGPLTQAIDPNQVNQLVEALVTALNGNRTQVNAIVSEFKTVLGTLASRKDTISQLLGDYQTITGAVAKRDLEIQTMVDNLATLSKAFADSGQVLDDALVQLPLLADGLRTLLSANADELGRTIDSLAGVTGEIHEHLGDLSTFLDSFGGAETALLRATSYGEFVLINNVCIATKAPPCPTPIILAANSAGVGAVATPASFQSLLVGGPT